MYLIIQLNKISYNVSDINDASVSFLGSDIKCYRLIPFVFCITNFVTSPKYGYAANFFKYTKLMIRRFRLKHGFLRRPPPLRIMCLVILLIINRVGFLWYHPRLNSSSTPPHMTAKTNPRRQKSMKSDDRRRPCLHSWILHNRGHFSRWYRQVLMLSRSWRSMTPPYSLRISVWRLMQIAALNVYFEDREGALWLLVTNGR